MRLRLNGPTPSTLNLRLRATLLEPELSGFSLSQNIEIAPNAAEHLAPWTGGLPLIGDWTAAALDDPPLAFSDAIAGVDDPAAVVAAPLRALRILLDDRAPTAPYLELENDQRPHICGRRGGEAVLCAQSACRRTCCRPR